MLLIARTLKLACIAIGVVSTVGCASKMQPHVAVAREAIAERATIDFAGLTPPQIIELVKAEGALPVSWSATKPKQTALYTDMQWRSPSKTVAVGVTSIRMPLPLSSKMLMWFAQREYAKRAGDAKLLSNWTDDAGRQWFEAETNDYHIRGFLLTRGFEGWVFYSGFKLKKAPDVSELAVGARAVDTFAPMQSHETRITSGGEKDDQM